MLANIGLTFGSISIVYIADGLGRFSDVRTIGAQVNNAFFKENTSCAFSPFEKSYCISGALAVYHGLFRSFCFFTVAAVVFWREATGSVFKLQNNVAEFTWPPFRSAA